MTGRLAIELDPPRLLPPPEAPFVTVRGTEYLFVPGRAGLAWIAGLDDGERCLSRSASPSASCRPGSRSAPCRPRPVRASGCWPMGGTAFSDRSGKGPTRRCSSPRTPSSLATSRSPRADAPPPTRSACERFRREVQKMAGLVGSSVIPNDVHDVGEEDGLTYIVSQYLAGGSVADRLQRQTDRRMPVAEALAVVRQVERGARSRAQADDRASRSQAGQRAPHQGGHRSARRLRHRHRAGRGSITSEYVLVGTVPYMSPSRPRRRAHLTAAVTCTRSG